MNQGFRVLRSWNPEVATGIADVCETILAALDERLAPHDRYRVPAPENPSSGPSGHLLPGGEKGATLYDRDTP